MPPNKVAVTIARLDGPRLGGHIGHGRALGHALGDHDWRVLTRSDGRSRRRRKRAS